MRFSQPLLAFGLILNAVCGPLAATTAPPDGLNIPANFAGQLLATQKIQTNYLDDTSPFQRFGEGSVLDQLFVNPNVAHGFLHVASQSTGSSCSLIS
jgi:hypothetical protein